MLLLRCFETTMVFQSAVSVYLYYLHQPLRRGHNIDQKRSHVNKDIECFFLSLVRSLCRNSQKRIFNIRF